MVYSHAEYDRWKRKQEVARTNQTKCLIGSTSISLEPGEKFEAIIKFLTFRETSHKVNEKSNEEIIKQRFVKIDVMRRGH
jgi:hypothetical protein